MQYIKQNDALEDYVNEFEDLRSLLLREHVSSFNKYVLSFIGGLKPSTKPFVKALNPNFYC